MTQEEQQLVLKDICARLAYNPFCKVDGLDSPIRLIRVEVDTVDGILLAFDYKNEQGLPLEVYLSEVKLYLRPMTSMTDKEEKEFLEIIDNYGSDTNAFDGFELGDDVDWLNKKGFDYRGLIPMGLALEAHEGMYNIK